MIKNMHGMFAPLFSTRDADQICEVGDRQVSAQITTIHHSYELWVAVRKIHPLHACRVGCR